MIPRALALRDFRRQALATLAAVVSLIALAGCASHSTSLIEVRNSLLQGDVADALDRFESQEANSKDLLYLLEKGYLLHLSGEYAASNETFAAAEQLADDLYTRSITRTIAAFATSDNTFAYRGLPYELQLVQYYRALNYLELGDPNGALVEARKANEFVERYRDEADESPDGFHQNAFLDCFTGLLYESEGETNDALVSFRNAWNGFADDEGRFGVDAPLELARAYRRSALKIGNQDEARRIADVETAAISSASQEPGPDDVRVLVFFESGFVPHRESVDINLPIFDDDADAWTRAGLYADRYGPHIYGYADASDLDHVLRFSFPRLEQLPSAIVRAELLLPDGRQIDASPALDLATVAETEFYEALPGTLLRTVARAFTKEFARKKAKEENEVLGWIVNAINVATENADTRSWIFLPGRIDMAEAVVPFGTEQIRARFLDRHGNTVEEWTLDLDDSSLETRFVALRSFR